MKIKELFKKVKGNNLITIVLSISCIIMIGITINNTEKYNLFSFCYPIEHIWQYFTGIFVHGIPNISYAFSIGHLCFNLVMLVFWGLLVEKIIGDKAFSILVIITWIFNSLAIQIYGRLFIPIGETGRGAGISCICFMLGTIGIYILLKLYKNNKKTIFKQLLGIIYLNLIFALIVMFNPFVAGIASFAIHTLGVMIGIIYILVNKKNIDIKIDNIVSDENIINDKLKVIYFWWVVPIFIIIINIFN